MAKLYSAHRFSPTFYIFTKDIPYTSGFHMKLSSLHCHILRPFIFRHSLTLLHEDLIFISTPFENSICYQRDERCCIEASINSICYHRQVNSPTRKKGHMKIEMLTVVSCPIDYYYFYN